MINQARASENSKALRGSCEAFGDNDNVLNSKGFFALRAERVNLEKIYLYKIEA